MAMRAFRKRLLRSVQLAVGMAAAAAFVAFGPAPASAAEGGTIVWGKPSEILGFDPHVEVNGVSWQFLYLTYENLVTTGDDLSIQPQIAESWEETSPTSYTFHLRAGATFSNGRQVTADDVVGSLKRVLDPALASVWAVQMGPITDVVAVDPATVRIDLSKPYAALLPALAGINAAIIPMKELADGSFDPSKDLLGSGPYMLVEHKQDESWVFARNPHYWQAGQPVADTLDILIIPDDAARIAALRDGRVDIANFDSPDAPLLLQGVADVTTVVQQTTNYYRLDVNALRADSPFHDARIRRAMEYALDRQQISDIALAGTGQVDYPLPRAFAQSEACAALPSYAEPREARLEQARAWLSEAGADGLEVQLIASPAVPVFPLIAQVIQSNLAEVGLEVEILQLPAAEWLERSFSTGQFDFALSWFAGYADPSMVLGWWDPEFAKWNKVFLEPNPELAALLDQAKQTADGPERQTLFAEICGKIDEQATILSLVGKPDIVAWRTDRITADIQPVEGYFDTLKHVETFARVAP